MRIPATALVTFLLLLCASPQAFADGAMAGADIHVAQTLGSRELTVVLRRVDVVPGPLRVNVITHAGSPPGRLSLRLVATGASLTSGPVAPSATTVDLRDRPGSHDATLLVSRPGPQELALQMLGPASGSSFDDVARIPFVVPVPVLSPAERVTYGGFVAAGVLLFVSLVVSVKARHSWMALVPGGGVVAALAVAVTAALLSASTPAPPVPGEDIDATVDNVLDPYSVRPQSVVDASRPPANVLVSQEFVPGGVELALRFVDGASGRAVDDLLIHDSALAHLLVVPPSGALRHLHPVRVEPGEYRVHLAAPEPGYHAVSVEIARRGGGVQLLRSATGFTVPGTPRPAIPTSETVRAKGGSPTTITARFGEKRDLQPWLGMVGHLIVVGPLPEEPEVGRAAASAATWSHVHHMAPLTRGGAGGLPDETVAAFGPEVSFTHTFTLPGRYRAWIQAEREYALTTKPVEIVVSPGKEPR
ncbi:hypothetical protein [Allokutzneria albata]|uniref:Secreted protein n=1 Tax=Allokutzneria albata TaxID=211114 RepID=A0A1G9RX31_ALLAB|nr:hypothetical protein [Allokutzneria albata]SDM27819.1 hypothetical protein SAMN04489726_0750 [Allokutzneria albata]